MTAHLTPQQVTEWRSGVSSAEELLRLDDHLTECAACRILLAADVQSLQREFTSAHLTESQLDDYAARRPQPAEVMQHVENCAECREDADDLRRFADTVRSKVVTMRRSLPVWTMPVAAAIAVTALGLTAWLTLNRKEALVPAPPAVAALTTTPFDAEVKAALDSGTLHIPVSVQELTSGPIQLRSLEAPAVKAPAALRVLSPLATAVVDDKPIFRWTPVAGATYSIAVYDDEFRPVASAVSLTDPQWQPEKAFARGAAYRWEVKAIRGKQVERAPTQTDPEARFSVLPEAESQRLISARAALAGKPLAMGIIYADAGAVEDARRELAAETDPQQKTIAEKLLAQLR